MPDSKYGDLSKLILRDIQFIEDLLKLKNPEYTAEIAFKVQQLIEKVFKLILYSSGLSDVSVRKCGHNLILLSNMAMQMGMNIPKEIIVVISKANTWESATRYDYDFSNNIDINVVRDAFNKIKKYALKVVNN